MSLTDMIVRPRFQEDGTIWRYTILKGSRRFSIARSDLTGQWVTLDADALVADPLTAPELHSASDLSDSLGYIEGLFR